MAYSDDGVRAKLSGMNETQDSIVTNAQWIMFHRRHADRTATLWFQRLQELPPNKRLNLIYLANEVVQQSRARGKQDFMVAFEPLIRDATSLAYKGASQEVQGKIRRVVEVWRQRNIFDARIQESVEKGLDEIDKSKGGNKLGGGGGRLGGSLFGGGTSGVAPELEGINKSQAAVNKAETTSKTPITSVNAEYAKMTDPATPVPSAPVRAAKLRGLVKDLMAAQNAVEASIKSRRELIAGLEKLIETNRAKFAEEETTSIDLRGKIDTIEGTIRDVEDSIMRGADAPAGNGFSNGDYNDPERPETEGFTPPPPDVESFTPPPIDHDVDETIGASAPLEAPFSNPTSADPIQEQPPNFNEPPPSVVPPPALPQQDSASAQAHDFLANLNALTSSMRQPSGEVTDPRLKRRKLSHKSNDVDDEIFGSGKTHCHCINLLVRTDTCIGNVGGVDEDGISAMLGQ